MTKARELSDYTGLQGDLAGLQTNITAGDTAARAGRKNLIINGAMQVAQRGTSATSQTSTAYLALDRWKTEASGATYNVSQQAMSASDLLTTGSANFLRMEETIGNNNSGLSQKIEASSIRQFKGKKLTASFYAKGTNPNGGSFTLSRFFSDTTNSSTAEHTSFSITSSWQRYTITFDYPSEGAANLALSTAFMAFSFLQPAGDTTTNAWTLDITNVQLELGSVATDFEHRSIGEELALCQRYFSKSNNYETTPADGSDSESISIVIDMASDLMRTGTIYFPTQMRVSPSVTRLKESGVGGGSSGQWAWFQSGVWTYGAFAPNNITNYGFSGHISSTSGTSDGRAYWMHINWTADAEL